MIGRRSGVIDFGAPNFSKSFPMFSTSKEYTLDSASGSGYLSSKLLKYVDLDDFSHFFVNLGTWQPPKKPIQVTTVV